MNFIEKCKIIGIGNGSAYEGYPVINESTFSKRDGTLKAYIRRVECKAWEDPLIEDPDFDSAILAKIQAIEDGKLTDLDQAEQDTIVAAELKETEEATAPTNAELLKRIEALENA